MSAEKDDNSQMINALLAIMGHGESGANAQNDREQAIRAVLEDMIKGPIPEPRGLLGVPLGGPPIPDFERHLRAKTYRELTEKIERMEKLIELARQLLMDLLEKDAPPLKLRMNVKLGEGLSFRNLIALNGVEHSALTSLGMFWISATDALEGTLSERRARFPQGPGKRRHPAPYGIADELARFYLRHTKERPTYGTTDGYPSTEYLKALQRLFEILDVRGPSGKLADLRRPAEAACKAITDNDIIQARNPNPPFNRLFDYLPRAD